MVGYRGLMRVTLMWIGLKTEGYEIGTSVASLLGPVVGGWVSGDVSVFENSMDVYFGVSSLHFYHGK